MVTRVRIEAEGSSPTEVEKQLITAHAALVDASRSEMIEMFGHGGPGNRYPGLANSQAGEFVVERFAKDVPGEGGPGPGHGALFYRGRMTVHFAKPSKVLDLSKRQEDDH